jgi:hypothetical protein
VTQSDDKPRGAQIREAARLRPTLGNEPGSGYAFHDQTRIDRVERPRARSLSGAPQTASHAPRERSFARTLVGNVTLEDALADDAQRPGARSENDQGPSLGWASMPQVPPELTGSVEDAQSSVQAVSLSELGSAGARGKKVSSHPPAGGAIWQALPSVTELPESPARESVPEILDAEEIFDADMISTVELRGAASARAPAVPSRASTTPPRNSQPAGYRPSAAELRADYRGAYRDTRLLKYEALVERNAWEQLSEEIAREQNLSPELRLLAVVAQRETLSANEKQDGARLTQEAIAVVAELLNVPPASPMALVIGKRLLRKNPAGWANRKQPSAGMSVGVLLGGIAAGAGVGWLVTTLLF